MPESIAAHIMPLHKELGVITVEHISSLLKAALIYRNSGEHQDVDILAIEQFMMLMQAAKRTEMPVRCIPFSIASSDASGELMPVMIPAL